MCAALVVKQVKGDRYIYSRHILVALLLTEAQSTPPVEWKYAKYPGSFKTCLQQMVLEGYTGVNGSCHLCVLIQYVAAFESAQKCMTIIQNRASGMPRNIQNAVNVVFNGSPQEVEAYVPDLIRSVLDSAEVCKDAAGQVERSFEGLAMLAEEIMLACSNKVSRYLTLLNRGTQE